MFILFLKTSLKDFYRLVNNFQKYFLCKNYTAIGLSVGCSFFV